MPVSRSLCWLTTRARGGKVKWAFLFDRSPTNPNSKLGRPGSIPAVEQPFHDGPRMPGQAQVLLGDPAQVAGRQAQQMRDPG